MLNIFNQYLKKLLTFFIVDKTLLQNNLLIKINIKYI